MRSEALGGWKRIRLEDICKKGSWAYGINESAVPYSPDLYRYLRITDITDEGLIDESKRVCVNIKRGEDSKYLLKENDIVFARTGASAGRNYFYDGNEDPMIFAGFLIKFSIDEEKVLPEYVKYYCSSRDYRDWVRSIATGSTRPNINAAMYRKMEVLLPPRKQQETLVDTLSCLDAKIKLNNKINENLEAQAQAMFKSWFVDFEPFQDGEFVESELGLIPEGWRVGLLGEFIELSSGKRPEKKAEIASFETPIPILGASKIMGYTDSVLFDEPILVTGRVGTHGVIQRHDSKCWPSDNTLVMRASHYEFVYQCLKRIDFASLNRGSTQPLITQTDLNNQAIAVPTACILRQFEHLASELMALINLNHQESAMLASLRDTLLPKLMSGEIEVPID
jgi:type I restriction enzyme S subunit